jgi:SAM-dependent methyltransferase
MTDATPADHTAGIAAPDNAAQAEAWNGGEGEYFAAERARHERMGQQHTQHLLDAAAITATDAVLDVGCGCGQTTIRAARAARDGHALGVDLSAVMLAEARRLAEQDGAGNVSFRQADAQTHPFPAGGFDVAISSFGVMFFADPRAAFANLAAALRPGGRLAFLCWQDLTGNPWLTIPFAAAAAHVTLPELPAADEPGPFSLADPQRTRDLLTEAGLGSIGIADVRGNAGWAPTSTT